MRSSGTTVSPFRRFLFETSLGRNNSWRSKLEQFRRWQDLGEQGTRELQEHLLEQILEHAARHVPYYHDLFHSHGLLSGGRVRIGALTEIPCLDRTTLRREFDRLRSDDLAQRSWIVNGTGGSTGEPVRFIQDRESGIWRATVEHLFDEWSGVPFGTRRVRLWGSERDLFVGRETFKVRFYRWRRNELSLNAFRMAPAQMRTYAERINEWRPGHILGYTDCLYEFSRFIEHSGLTVHSPGSIMATAGTLFPHQRETIERVFRAPLFNRYAAREFGGIASEDTAHNGMVVAAPDKVVEVLRPDGSPAGPLEEGEVVITSLSNYAMPLIRYKIGDLACMAGYRSERTGWPILAQVTGRVIDTFVRPDGGVVSPLYFIHLVGVVLSSGWIRRFQVVQEDLSRIVVHLVLEPPFTESSPDFNLRTRELADKIRLVMGEGCAVDFQVRDDIPAEPSGKYRYAISRVAR